MDPEVFKALLSQNPEMIKTIDQDEELCLIAVKANPNMIVYVKNQTDRICLETVRRKGTLLCYVKNKTRQICLAAVQNDENALVQVPAIMQTEEICVTALNQQNKRICAGLFNHIRNPSPELVKKLIQVNPYIIEHIKYLSLAQCEIAVKQDPKVFRTIAMPGLDLCLEMVMINPEVIKYVPKVYRTKCMEMIANANSA